MSLNREFAIKLFQVLNDRGMDLTSADLIKSYLLEKILKKYSGEDDVEMRDEKEKAVYGRLALLRTNHKRY